MSTISNPKIKSEAQRALVNIKSYDLKVFATTVNLGAINLADVDEETEKKQSKNQKKDDTQTVTDDLVACLELIRASAPNCSIMLIADTIDTLRIVANSINPDLKAVEWVQSAANLVQGKVVNQNGTDAAADFVIKMNEGASSLKEKENALAANFAYLRKQGLSEESDDEETHTFNLDDI